MVVAAAASAAPEAVAVLAPAVLAAARAPVVLEEVRAPVVLVARLQEDHTPAVLVARLQEAHAPADSLADFIIAHPWASPASAAAPLWLRLSRLYGVSAGRPCHSGRSVDMDFLSGGCITAAGKINFL